MIKETFSKIQLLLQRKGLTRETATKDEKETIDTWEKIMALGDAAGFLKENEAFKAGLEMARQRQSALLGELLKMDNDKEKDLTLKAEINHIQTFFNYFLGLKRAKEQLEEDLNSQLK